MCETLNMLSKDIIVSVIVSDYISSKPKTS